MTRQIPVPGPKWAVARVYFPGWHWSPRPEAVSGTNFELLWNPLLMRIWLNNRLHEFGVFRSSQLIYR